MPIRSIAQLKAWFRRGKYPTEEQFGDWMDSYVHKDEDTIPIAQVENLPEQLNAKYSMSDGTELERKHQELQTSFESHKKDADNDFKQLFGNVNDLEDEDERLQGEIDNLNTEVENIHKKDTEQDKEITALHKADSDQQVEINTAATNLEHLRKRVHPTVAFASLESTFSALGENYSTLWALANTLKTFLDAKDTADSTINRWKEIETFLQGITDTETLSGLLEQLEKDITAAYDRAIAAAVKVESDRAKGAEATLQTNIDGEQQRAEAAETALGKRITDTKAVLQQTDAEIRQDIAAVRQTILAIQADSAGRVIPLVMTVEPPRRITYGNPVKQYIKASLLPQFAVQNVLWLSDGKAVDVEPDGEVVVLGLGISRVHVIPTENTALHQTITVEVVRPSLIKSGHASLLLAGANILFT
ncbi:hypothetical protein AAH174_05710 [Bacteroides thetaiotaomicron]|uniref:coiled-coil domain-containing protein n=1 Tax=Bacteroides thetaiotaomicron TaxID=818 RepID=UPI0039B6C20C